jgi:hypothetical protein
MRPHGQTKLGFFPLPIPEANRLRNCLRFSGPFSAADAVWKALNSEHQKLISTTSPSNGDTSPAELATVLIDAQCDPARLVEAAIDTSSILAFGQRTDALSGRRRRTRPTVPEQGSLFSWN